jgi:excisionase family DNA binding protein
MRKTTPKPTQPLKDPNSLGPWLSVEEVAAILSVHYLTVLKMCQDGKLPGAKKFGGSWRIPKVAVLPPDIVPKQ